MNRGRIISQKMLQLGVESGQSVEGMFGEFDGRPVVVIGGRGIQSFCRRNS